jgi:hypothetical protein
MKIIKREILIASAILLFAPVLPASAIEGLQISVQCSNVVLSWPSTEGETYIVQFRQTLATTDTWQTLTDYLPAVTGTNVTAFVHTNAVLYPNCGVGSFGTMAANRSMAISAPSLPAVPMAIPRDGSSAGVPACLYPPGSDMSGFVIVDPVSGESVNGSIFATARALASSDPLFNGPEPMGGDGGTGSSTPEPGTGFYRVVRDGVHICGMTNGMVLSGEMKFPIEFAVGSTDEIVGVAFYDENGSPITGASAQGAGNYWIMDWNTFMSFNGDYNIYAELDFASDDAVVSTPVTVTVNNTISFPNYFSRVFGDQMWIFAQTIPDAAYEIDIYDQSTNYLGSFYDNADDGGYISFIWDLSDGNGNTFDSTNFFGVFTVDTSSLSNLSKARAKNLSASSSGLQMSSPAKKTFGGKAQANRVQPADAGSSSSATQVWLKEWPWSPGDGWAIGYSPVAANDTAAGYYIGEMLVGGDGGEYGGVVSTLGDYGLGAQMSPGNAAQSSAFEMDNTNSRAQFLSYLADFRYRHCYFYGHGSPVSFGTDKAVITQDDVASGLLNFPLSGLLLLGAAHPYQFVFIDACNAGKGNMCEAFGIPALTVNNQYFAYMHIQSRAFLGFRSTTSFNPNDWVAHSLNLGFFFEDWLGYAPLQNCVNNAVNDIHGSGYNMSSSWVIYGATDLQRNTDTTQ